MLELIAKFIAVLNSNQRPGQVAFSLVLGMILGLTPLLMPHNLIVLFFILILRVNLSALLLSLALFSGIGYLMDPLSEQLGLWVLQHPALQSLFTDWYNNGWWRLTHFNNSLLMGSVLIAYSLSLPAFLLFWMLVKIYRQRFIQWVNKFKLVKALHAARGIKLVAEVTS